MILLALIILAYSELSLFRASLALVELKNPIVLYGGSRSVDRDMMLIDCRLWSFSLRSLERCSPNSLASGADVVMASS